MMYPDACLFNSAFSELAYIFKIPKSELNVFFNCEVVDGTALLQNIETIVKYARSNNDQETRKI